MEGTTKRRTLPAQGARRPRARRGNVIVPDRSASSSRDGQPVERNAGTAWLRATAELMTSEDEDHDDIPLEAKDDLYYLRECCTSAKFFLKYLVRQLTEEVDISKKDQETLETYILHLWEPIRLMRLKVAAMRAADKVVQTKDGSTQTDTLARSHACTQTILKQEKDGSMQTETPTSSHACVQTSLNPIKSRGVQTDIPMDFRMVSELAERAVTTAIEKHTSHLRDDVTSLKEEVVRLSASLSEIQSNRTKEKEPEAPTTTKADTCSAPEEIQETLADRIRHRIINKDEKSKTPTGENRRKRLIKDEIKKIVLNQDRTQRKETRKVEREKKTPPAATLPPSLTLSTQEEGPKLKMTNKASETISQSSQEWELQTARRKSRKKKTDLTETEVITLTLLPGSRLTHMDAFKHLKKSVDPADCGILPGELSIRMANKSTMVLKIRGRNKQAKADSFAKKLTDVTNKEDSFKIRINRPKTKQKNVEFLIRGFDETSTKDDIYEAVTSAGHCKAEDILLGRTNFSRGSGTIWMRCPAAAARNIGKMSKKMTIGWSVVTIKTLEERPPMCHRCLQVGHLQADCRNLAVRNNRCYRCGDKSHIKAECNAEKPQCPLCVDIEGHSADHILGCRGCYNYNKEWPPLGSRKKMETGEETTLAPSPSPLSLSSPSH